MAWFYFTDSNGNRHYANSREEAEQLRKKVGVENIIYQTDIPPKRNANTRPESPVAKSSPIQPAVLRNRPVENDTSWMLRSDELIYGQNKYYPALQIYHPTRSELHGRNDRRILSLKNGDRDAVAHYCASLKALLPMESPIMLCCAPSSKAGSVSGTMQIIRSVSGGLVLDGSNVLTALYDREKKNNGARFTDQELSSSIGIKPLSVPERTRIVLIDDVVTSGQTLRVCNEILKSAYPQHRICCLSLSSTDYESITQGIADRIVTSSISDALKPLHERPANSSPHLMKSVDISRGSMPTSVDSAEQRATTNSRPVRRSTSSPPARTLVPASRPTPGSQGHKKQASSTSSGDCFVVTAIYRGDTRHPNVRKLRHFRDSKIASHPIGPIIISLYKRVGPWLAKLVLWLKIDFVLRLILNRLMREN
jgi:hypothetical protein